MPKNLNTGVWTVDGSGYTQTLANLFTGGTPVYTHAQHIDNSFNLAVCGVSGQNSRMLFHLTDRTRDDGYSVDSTSNIFIGDYIYDNRGNYTDAIGVAYGNVGGVSNFVIDPNSGSQPTANFKIAVEYPYRDIIWYPAINIRTLDPSNGTIGSDNWHTLNDLDGVSTAVDAQSGETWWEYYKRNESNYILTIGQNNQSMYYKIGSFDSTSVFEGERTAGIPYVLVRWLKHPRSYLNYDYQGAYPYYDNNRGYYDDLQFDLLLPFSSDWAVKKAEWNNTRWTEYWTEEQHNIIYGLKIDKDIVLKLICSYGMPFSFGSSTTIQFADPDYALPEIVKNVITGNYFRGDECATADTDNNRWGNVKNIDNKPAGGGGGGDDDDLDDHEMGAGTGISGMANLWLLTKSQLNDLHGAFNSAPAGFDPLNSLISVMGLGVAPTYLMDEIEVITPINIRMSDGTSWSTHVEGHIVSSQKSAFQFTEITVNRKYNNFLDFSPYAIHEIFIPMCGWLTLPDIAVDRSITVTYLPDIESLKCRAVVSVVDNSGHRCVIGEKDGIMGADVPFTNTGHSLYVGESIINAANVAGEVITGAIGAGFTKTGASGKSFRPYEGFTVGMAGTLPGAIGNAFVSGQTNRTHYMTGNGTRIGFSDGENIQIKSTYHRIDKPTNYDHTVGKVCNKTGKLSTFSGFTVCDNPHITFSALEDEKAEIKRLLEEGVIL